MSRIEPLAGLIFGLELRLEEAKEGRQPLEVALFLEQHHLHCLLIFCATSIIYQCRQNLNFQVRLKEAETLGRRQESEVAIVGINSNIFSVINIINNIIINIMDTIIALYRHQYPDHTNTRWLLLRVLLVLGLVSLQGLTSGSHHAISGQYNLDD